MDPVTRLNTAPEGRSRGRTFCIPVCIPETGYRRLNTNCAEMDSTRPRESDNCVKLAPKWLGLRLN